MTQFDRAAEDRIRRWLLAQPEQAGERAVDETVARLRTTEQPRMLVLRLSLPVAAAAALVTLAMLGLGLWAGLSGRIPAGAVLPSPSAACSLDSVVGGQHPVIVGRGFAADTDVVLEIDRANGTHVTLTSAELPELRTDRQGRFGVSLEPFEEDLGRGQATATAGCTASIEIVVTADQLPEMCPDRSDRPVALRDSSAYRAAVAADRPVHLWHFDEAGAAAATDGFGSADGELVADATIVAGAEGAGAVFLDGSEAYVAVPTVTLGDFTLEAWVFLCEAVDNQDAIVGHSAGAPDVNFFERRLRLFSGDVDVVIAATDASNDRWQHWAVTRDAVDTRIYLNGSLDAIGEAWSGDMVIDQIGRGGAGLLRGMLDEIALYDRALSEAELARHAQAP